jgi:apolipoprotein D and lipocalin family protein
MKTRLAIVPIVVTVLATNCTGVPKGVQPVTDFDVTRYLGKWHEIARLDHSFERGLTNVSAEYSGRDDGGINVVNRGYDESAGKWKEVRGKAYFIGDKTVGSLKVSFFGPFYGGYHILVLDEQNYAYSLVCGPNRSYLWILARGRKLDERLLSDLTTKARQWGFDTDKLIYVKQDRTDG